MPDRRWYAARAKPGQERLAIGRLERQGFDAYFPRIVVERVRRGRITTESEGLFPGYVLVKFALEPAAWRAVNGTRGITRLLSFRDDGRPQPLPRGEIERLQMREKLGQLYTSEVRRIRRGDLVRLKVGPAVDRIGEVVRTRGERVELLLSLLGAEVSVSAPQHALEVVGRR